MMCIISKERIAFCTLVEGTHGVVFAASPIALQFRCKRVPNEPIPRYGYSWLSTPECSFKIGDRQSEKKRWNSDRRAICNVMRGIEAGCGAIHHRVVSDSSEGAHPLWRSHSAQTEIFFADVSLPTGECRELTTCSCEVGLWITGYTLPQILFTIRIDGLWITVAITSYLRPEI